MGTKEGGFLGRVKGDAAAIEGTNLVSTGALWKMPGFWV